MVRFAHTQAMHTRAMLSVALTLAVSFSTARAQSTPIPATQPQSAPIEIPTFEVISVKPAKPAPGWRESASPDGYSAQSVTLKTLLMHAYDIRPDYRILGAPSWSDTNRYDIQAKVGDSSLPALKALDFRQRGAMLQQILTDRFKLKVHREDRPQPIYSLIVTKKNLLMETAPPADGKNDPPSGGIRRGRSGQWTATGPFTMAELVAQFSGLLSRMVIDNTGLTGRYDIKLNWTQDDVNGDAGQPSPGPSAPSIFTALQEQLGLKLVPTTGPVEFLVVDHVEPPTEN